MPGLDLARRRPAGGAQAQRGRPPGARAAVCVDCGVSRYRCAARTPPHGASRHGERVTESETVSFTGCGCFGVQTGRDGGTC
eukprot:3002929-Prymnesium_polylepis.1